LRWASGFSLRRWSSTPPRFIVLSGELFTVVDR
ncbi:hypothetical protein A2U01_0110698, partial [Trifolium medium]|nr:hypothetical protein [Trifolium medium]